MRGFKNSDNEDIGQKDDFAKPSKSVLFSSKWH